MLLIAVVVGAIVVIATASIVVFVVTQQHQRDKDTRASARLPGRDTALVRNPIYSGESPASGNQSWFHGVLTDAHWQTPRCLHSHLAEAHSVCLSSRATRLPLRTVTDLLHKGVPWRITVVHNTIAWHSHYESHPYRTPCTRVLPHSGTGFFLYLFE